MISGSAPAALKAVSAAQIAEIELAESSRIDKAQFLATLKFQPRVSVRRNWSVGSSDKQPPGHAEMDNPLRVRLQLGFAATAALRSSGKLADDVLSGSVHATSTRPSRPLACRAAGVLNNLR